MATRFMSRLGGLFRKATPVEVSTTVPRSEDQASSLREVMSANGPTAESDAESLDAGDEDPKSSDDALSCLIEPSPEFALTPEGPDHAEALKELMQQIGRHLDQQSTRSERMVALMERVPDSLDALPKIQKKSEALVESVSDQIGRQNERDEQLRAALQLIAVSAGRQTEVLDQFRQTLQADQERSNRVVTTLTDFREALDGFGRTNDKAIDLIGKLSRRGEARQDQLAEMIEKSHRSMLLVLGSTIFIAAAGLVIAILALFRG